MELTVATADDTEALGGCLARVCGGGCTVHLHGELGAGKTTLVRGFLHGQGYRGRVKSPTYTLVEPYELAGQRIYHFDLYRLADPEELEFLGVRDYLSPDAVCLIEWPERGGALLPLPDINLHITYQNTARRVRVSSATGKGRAILRRLRGVAATAF